MLIALECWDLMKLSQLSWGPVFLATDPYLSLSLYPPPPPVLRRGIGTRVAEGTRGLIAPPPQWTIWLKIGSVLKKKSSFILVARIDPWNTLIPNLVLFYLFEAWKASEKGFKGRRSWPWNSRKKIHYCKTVLKKLDGISESRSLEQSSTRTEKEKSEG